MVLAQIGLGRTRLDRANYAGAATAVAGVPTNFVYNTELQPSQAGAPYNVNFYGAMLPVDYGCGQMNVSNQEGGNGLNFITAQDPRVAFDSTIGPTCDGGTWYYPVKFGNPSTFIPLATGVEARLIEAEVALQGGNVSQWAADLNALRADPGDTKVTFPPATVTIPSDSTTGATASAQLDMMFREREMWLFGTGTRFSDLRRLVRQYGRDVNTVWPTGPYASGANSSLPIPLPAYGADVSFTLPTKASNVTTGNPNYKGCLSPTSTS
jgi:hypothetical protein